MLQPKRTKYRKMHKGRNDSLAWSGNAVSFGEFGLKSTAFGQLTARQIEAARRSISRYVKRGGKMWIRVFPDKPITKKPIEVRMGSGKGNVEYWVAQIQPGRMIYEIEGVSEEVAREAVPPGRGQAVGDHHFVTRTVARWTQAMRQKSGDELKTHGGPAEGAVAAHARKKPLASCPRPTRPPCAAARSLADMLLGDKK